MGARAAMVAGLEAGLDTDKVRIVPDPRTPSQALPAELDALLQVALVSIEPTSTMGQLRGDFELHLVVPYSDPAVGEEKLEAALDMVLELLLSPPFAWFHFDKATRSVYAESQLSYKITGFSQLKVEDD